MQKRSGEPSLLRQAVGILNSIWLIIFLTYFLDVIVYPWALRLMGPATLAFLVPLKIYFYSGIYGSLIEIAGGEEILLTYKNFRTNARRFWKYTGALTVFAFALEFFLSSVLPADRQAAAPIFARHIDMILLYALAWLISGEKYGEPGLPAKKIRLNAAAAGTIFILYILEMLIFYRPHLIALNNISIINIISVAAKYIHFLEFLVLSMLILKQYPQVKEKFTSGRELYLIFPPLNGREGPVADLCGRLLLCQQPPMFVVLKALTPADYRIRKFNKVLWQDRYYAANKLVAIGCFSSNCAEAYRIAREFKKRGSTVVMGGPHVSYLPDEALEFCDTVVIGEAEGIWEQLIKDYETGSLKKTYSGGRIDDCHHLVYEELLNSPPNVIKDFLETSRGCKFKCNFCMIPSINEGKARNHPTFELVELIKKVTPRYRRITFIDNNIYNDPAYARELFKALKPLKIKWYSPCTIDIAQNEETLRLARESGCETFFIGYEVMPEEDGQHSGKFAMAGKYVEYTRRIKKLGIKIKGSFTLGWEAQNLQGLIQLSKFALQLKPFLTIPYLLTPFPGTPLFDEMMQQNRLINLNWKKFNQWHIVIKNNKLNNLLLECFYPLLAFFSYLFLSEAGHTILKAFLVCLAAIPLLAILLVWQRNLLGI